ncbi:unnamed protein product [Cylicocyclus nassatus]|uniref:Uncharacterized protein n=1 Tax=Cylicocyclus nassatus TaxID=53992 RepID=A0AA36H5N7_CYLNA|nr:unnamed protein product [Cylicocyclus nassatus]
MADGEVVQAISRTSVHEDIIKEVEETDWSVDPTEEEGLMSCSTANTSKTTEEAAKNSSSKVENGDEDVEFDPDELECVDEDAEDERRERKEREEERRRHERHKHEERKHHHSDTHSRHSVEHHHPYSRHDRDRRDYYGSDRLRRRSADHKRLRKPYDPRCRRVETYVPRRSRHSSGDKPHSREKERTAADDRDIPLDELELEEVDCCDEVGDDRSDYADGTSSACGSYSGEDDDYDGLSMSRSRGPNHMSSLGDGDDFPDLCEELDEDAMRRAAAAAAAKNIVLSSESQADVNSPPPPGTGKVVRKPHDDTYSHRRETELRRNGRNGEVAPSRHMRGSRHEDDARRRRHFMESNYKSRRGEWRRIDERRRGDDRTDKARSSRETPGAQRALVVTKSDTTTEMCRRDDAELISIKGPLAHGWYSGDEEEQMPTSSQSSPKSTYASDSERRMSVTQRSASVTDDADDTAKKVRLRSFTLVPPTRHNTNSAASPPPRIKNSSLPTSPRKRDLGKRGSSRDSSSSPVRKTPDHRRQQQQQQQTNGATVVHGNNVNGKIPSLLDMCIKEPKELQQGPSTVNGVTTSRALADAITQRIQRRDAAADKEIPKSRSLLDLDIPPPDRNLMRQYAIVLNSLELTQRPSYSRANRRKPEKMPVMARMSSPRLSDHYEHPRQPRLYVHGKRKLSQ